MQRIFASKVFGEMAAAGRDSGVCHSGCDLLDAGISAFICPITNSLFEEPVVAEDGRTYSKQAIRDWFAGCRERQLPVTSPYTRAEITEHLVPNFDMAKAMAEYTEEHAERKAAQAAKARAEAARRAEVRQCGGVHSAPSADSGKVKSLEELGAMFSLLDDLRELLAETLDGWHPPAIVVVGQENSGKSSLLERLMLIPLLPRDENICTRMPIHVRLRRSDRAMPPKLEIYNTHTKSTERGPYVIAAQSGAADVSEEMRRILTEEHGAIQGVSASRIIILHITSPNVPFLDLVDMPGMHMLCLSIYFLT